MFEDHLGEGEAVAACLVALGYRFVCGDTDEVFEGVAAAEVSAAGA